MKTVNDKNQIWFEHSNDIVTVGFTKSFLDSLDQCWHILPAHLQKFREKAPLMVVETNDNLISILSPVTAHFATWSDKAQNFPYKLNESDVVLEMNMVQARTQGIRRQAVVDEFVAPRAVRRLNPAAAVEDDPWRMDAHNGVVHDEVAAQQRAVQERIAIEQRAADMRGAIGAQPGVVRGRRGAGIF